MKSGTKHGGSLAREQGGIIGVGEESVMPRKTRPLLQKPSWRKAFPLPLLVVNAQGIIQEWWAEAERFFQLSASETVGRNLSLYLPGFSLGEPVPRSGRSRRVECRCHGGGVRSALCEIYPLPADGESFLIFLKPDKGVMPERVRFSLYHLSEAAAQTEDLKALFSRVHSIIGELMPVQNFYVSLYDPEGERLYFPYFVDQYDHPPSSRKASRGLTEYVIRTGKALLADPDVCLALERSGEIESHGTPGVDWLGAPLTVKNKVIGALVVQSYDPGVRYGEEEKNLLSFVAVQIAGAIQRKRDEAELRKNEAEFREIAERSFDLIFRLDRRLRLTYVSPAVLPILGYSPKGLIGSRITKLWPKERQEAIEAALQQVLSGTSVTGLEISLSSKNGRTVYCEINLSPILRKTGTVGALGLLRDVTARKAVETALRESERKFRDFFEKSKDTVFFCAPNGRILDINPAGFKLLGCSNREEVRTSNLWLFLKEEEKERLLERVLSGESVKDDPLSLKRRDGQWLDVLATVEAETNAEGKPLYFRGMIRDVTEQKRMERQLFQKQKMESIGLLAGGIAHDFNNILGGILGYASLMKLKIEGEHPFLSYIETIEKSAKRAAELTGQLLAFARGGKYDVRAVNLLNVVEETVKILRQTFDKRIEVVVQQGRNNPIVEGDPAQLQQVVLNLCVNARDAMPEGGKLILETGEIVLGEGVEKGGRYVVLSVTDTGVGMSEEVKTRIFEPFFTTKADGQGSGLGLSLVYGVVKNHGGFVRVYSELGEGSTFRVYLPFSGKDIVQEKEEEFDTKGKGEKVLVVDDEETIREFTKEVLEGSGYSVEMAKDGEEAVRAYERGWQGFDLVILDMVMPKLGGREVYERMLRINPKVKVVLTTGYSRNGRAREILDEGVQGFIQKPYVGPELLKRVRLVLDEGEKLHG